MITLQRKGNGSTRYKMKINKDNKETLGDLYMSGASDIIVSTRWWNYLHSSWQLFTVCYILIVFIYDFNTLSTGLQQASFYRVKDSLSKDKRPSFADRKGTV